MSSGALPAGAITSAPLGVGESHVFRLYFPFVSRALMSTESFFPHLTPSYSPGPFTQLGRVCDGGVISKSNELKIFRFMLIRYA